MNAERDRRLIHIVEAALRVTPDTRAELLEEAAGGDEGLLREAWELLRATTGNPHFLTSWAAGKAASLVETSLSLRAGDSLGPYRIERRLASGGMGEVYEATDLRLRRRVAIKVLATAASDSATRTRILEEARIISRLNHPLICGVYDVGIDDGVPYLVMQLLEGATLRETLQQKLPPPAIALGWSIDIADALHHAHSAGVVHRDLKPENIVITRTGATLIDFGISALIAAESAHSQDAGTLPYMSPEQLRGEPATPLSDLFSFGAILFELLHGRPAFAGADPQAIANSILGNERTSAEPTVKLPATFHDLIDRCLKPSAGERWQSALDAAAVLRWVRSGSFAPAAPPARRRSWKWSLVAATGAALFVAAAYMWFAPLNERPRAPVTFTIDAEPGARLVRPVQLAVAPDGKSLAYVAVERGLTHIYVRSLQQPHAHEVRGTENAQHPFWSPDSAVLGFFADGKLKRVASSGGPAVIVCDAPRATAGTWGSNGVILFAGGRGAVFKVDAPGGKPEPATSLNSRDEDGIHEWPAFLPDGTSFLYIARSNRHEGKLYAGTVPDTRATYLLDTPSQAIFSRGKLYYRRGTNLIAQPFNPVTLRAYGDTAPVAERVGAHSFSVSETGVVAYWDGARSEPSLLTWVDRSGKELETIGPPAQYDGVTLSPKGDSVIATVCESIDCQDPTNTNYVRTYNLRLLRKNGEEVRLTNDQAVAATPVWSPPGDELIFGSTRAGHMSLYRRHIASAKETPLLAAGPDRGAGSWSADGRYVAYTELQPGTGFDVWILDLHTGIPFLFRGTNANETAAAFSPNGKWIAYSADDSGKMQVYIAPFNGPSPSAASSDPLRVSPETGFLPIWRADGSELYYYAGMNLMAVSLRATNGKIVAGTPRLLFPLRRIATMGNSYAAAPDGKHFLILGSAPLSDSPITVEIP